MAPKPPGVHRRECLRIGGLSLLGLNLVDLESLRAASENRQQRNSCVFIFLFGGPSHIDLWDMKPKAPVEIRGAFQAAATATPGISICEHLPLLARQMDKVCLLRSMTHSMNVHGPACSEVYTGRQYFGPPVTDQATPEDWPSISSLVMRFGESAGRLPPSVVLPWYSQFTGQSKRIAGQTGGRMGENFDPVLMKGDPSRADFSATGLNYRPGSGPQRMAARRDLLRQFNRLSPSSEASSAAASTLQRHREMAFAMLHQPKFTNAFDLTSVLSTRRDRYGDTKFGQSLLLAGRLVEAGVSLITVNWDDPTNADKVSPFWDTHHDNFPKLKNHLCPLFDQAFSAFLDDLDQSGLLETTLVVVLGEFGRTPRIGQFSQNGMTQKTGRDHWPHAFTALLAGAGVGGGQVYGATNRNGGYVADKPVSPADLSATILDRLGVDPGQQYHDRFQNVSRRLSTGRVLSDLG